MYRRPMLALALAAVLAVAASCDTSPVASDSDARIRILLTDEPADYLEEARVWISRVYLVPGATESEGDGPPFVDLFNDAENPQEYDLLLLRDGITADLTGDVELPTGVFGQLRLIVDRAEVTLKEGYEFSDGSMTRELFVPSGAQSGIKVMLDEPIETEGGVLTIVVVDFDVNENFVMQGNPDTPAGIHGMLFTPMLKEKERSEQAG